jgi:zinc protease
MRRRRLRGGRGGASRRPTLLHSGIGPPVLLPVAGDPTVSLALGFRVGSQDDPPGKEGLAYLTGQMLAEASTQDLAYERILEALYPMAAAYDLRVDKETSTLTGRCHRDTLEGYIGLFAAAYQRPAFRADDFERLRSAAVNYLETTLRYASDEELAKAALQASVFDGTGYAHPPQGTVQGLRAITLDDVRSFYARYYTQANATLGIGGGYEPGLPAHLQRSLEMLPVIAPGPRSGIGPRPSAGRHVWLIAKPDADASVSLGFPLAVQRGERDFYALWVANSWLGEHRSSVGRLYDVIRAQRGLNYGDYSYVEAFPEGSHRSMPPTNVARRHQLFEIWIRTLPNGQAHFALRAALFELDRLVTEGLSREQFELTRTFLKKYLLHFAAATEAQLGYALDDRFYGIGSPGHLQRFQQILDTLEVADVNAAIRTHLQTRNLHIAIVTGAAESLAASLSADAPTRVEYPVPQSPDLLAEDRRIAALPLGIERRAIRITPVETAFESGCRQ